MVVDRAQVSVNFRPCLEGAISASDFPGGLSFPRRCFSDQSDLSYLISFDIQIKTVAKSMTMPFGGPT